MKRTELSTSISHEAQELAKSPDNELPADLAKTEVTELQKQSAINEEALRAALMCFQVADPNQGGRDVVVEIRCGCRW